MSTARRLQGVALPLAAAGTVAAATIALHFRDPHEQGSWGICPTKALFGVDCPGCGGLRAVNDLTNLQLVDAASSNLLLVAAIPLVLYAFVRWTAGRWTGRPWEAPLLSSRFSAVSILAVLAIFAVVRNTTAGSWLAP